MATLVSYELRNAELNIAGSDEDPAPEYYKPVLCDKTNARVELFEERGVRGIASFNTRYIHVIDKPTGDWMDDLSECRSFSSAFAYALFYRKNIAETLRLLQKVGELPGARDSLGVAIMRAECEIVMGRGNDVDLSKRVLNDLRCRVMDNDMTIDDESVSSFDYALKRSSRHIGRIFLHYMAYYNDSKKLEDDDWKMQMMAFRMGKIARRYTALTTGRRRYIMSATMRNVFRDWSKEPARLRGGHNKNKSYMKALCRNYEGWICILSGMDGKALLCLDDGIDIVRSMFKYNELCTLTLFGDLNANIAAASKNLNKIDDALEAYRVAETVYLRATDLHKGFQRSLLMMQLKKTGINQL